MRGFCSPRGMTPHSCAPIRDRNVRVGIDYPNRGTLTSSRDRQFRDGLDPDRAVFDSAPTGLRFMVPVLNLPKSLII